MRDYWLAKLISTVEEVDARKRLQKIIYLLQFRSGFPLKFDYFLHYYGPYSRDLTDLVDQLQTAGVVKEKCRGKAVSTAMTALGREVLGEFEKTPDGINAVGEIGKFLSDFEELNKRKLWDLELASTIAYFYSNDWEQAKKSAAEFKGVSLADRSLQDAYELAQTYRKSA